VVISADDLRGMNLEELQGVATQAGVGYAGLGQQALLEKLIHEGTVR
jgi:hypothetical protein